MPKFKAFLLVCVFILVSLPAQAKIIHVPADSSTIQKGINGAVNGDTVLVAPGTYYEHINFNGKVILVKSQIGAASTFISGHIPGLYIVTFNSQEDSSSTIEGFTIQNAQGDLTGGINCINSSPQIRNNIITDNFSWGIRLESSDAIIRDNDIAGNENYGIVLLGSSSPVCPAPSYCTTF